MASLFLDCGTGCGDSFEHFREIYSINEYDYMLFEPNPSFYKILLYKYSYEPIKLINKAIDTTVHKTKFYLYHKYDIGGSLLKEYNSILSLDKRVKTIYEKFIEDSNSDLDLLNENSIEVFCVDINEILFENKIKYDNIILNLDVELKEYDILENLIENKNINLITKLYVQFHSNFLNEPYKEIYLQREKNIIQYLIDNKINYNIIK